MQPGQDGDIEIHKGRYRDVGLCTGVVGGGSVSVYDTDSVSSGGRVGWWWILIVQEVFLEVFSSSGALLVVVVMLDGFELVPWSASRVVLKFWVWEVVVVVWTLVRLLI